MRLLAGSVIFSGFFVLFAFFAPLRETILTQRRKERKARIRPLAGSVILGWLFLGTWCAPACGDGGTMRMSVKSGGYLITVFTAPAPFRAGPVDISVLVQDALTGELVPQTRVTVRLTKPPLSISPQPPGEIEREVALEYPATREAATNKLLHAAQFELPEPGRWQWEVQVEGVHGLAVIGGELEAAPPLPRWRELWPWIGWPVLAIALFAIHQVLARRRSGVHPLHSRF